MTVKLKLAVGFGIMLLVLVLQGVISHNMFEDFSTVLGRVVHDVSMYESVSKEIDISMLMHRRYEKDYFINTGKQKKQAKYKKKLLKESGVMRSLLERVVILNSVLTDLPAEVQAKNVALGPLYDRYITGLLGVMEQMEQDPTITTQQANGMMKPYKVAIHDLEEDIAFIALTARELMNTSGRDAEESVQTAMHLQYSILAGGASVAVLLACLLSLSILRPLSALRSFASRTANGDFDAVAPKAAGEIGQLVNATADMKGMILKVFNEIDSMDENVTSGRILIRMDAEVFPGEYKKLAEKVNGVADSFTGFLDAVPAPVMMIDTNYKVLFMNKAGTDAGGGEARSQNGRSCYDFFCTDDCKTEKCACARAMESIASASSETTARPGGNELEIAYTASPITDRNGKVVGALEVVSDQTAIVKAQQKMVELASRASQISERVTTASEELSAQVEQISRGADLQRERIHETATAMEQMNATVLEVAQNAGMASESAEQAKTHADEGASVVNETVSAIAVVHSVTGDLKGNMAELGEQAESIGGVMNVITDIADQTNLLALNAAIEAARAGDAGRGFAVVADEVRKLAEKTMSATSEVGDRIQAIQDASRRNVAGMDQAASAVDQATGMANESGRSLEGIVQLSNDSAGMVQSIATAAEEQSAASEQINRAIDEINSVVGDTAEGMNQSAQAIVELSQLTVDLKGLIGELSPDEDGASTSLMS